MQKRRQEFRGRKKERTDLSHGWSITKVKLITRMMGKKKSNFWFPPQPKDFA